MKYWRLDYYRRHNWIDTKYIKDEFSLGLWVNFEWMVKTEDEIIAEIVRQFEAAKISK